MDKPILYKYFEDKAESLLADFKLSSGQGASKNLGDNRESFLNNFLKSVLPTKLNIRSGEILDSKDHKTGQIDTLIVRDDAPSLDYGGENTFLAEGVFGVIEVKSEITKAKIDESIRTLKKVKDLEIPKPTITMGSNNMERPLRVLFSYKSRLKIDTILDYLKEKNEEDLFDLICILNKGVIIKTGNLLYTYDKKTGEKFEELKFLILETKASSLGILYYYLIQYGTGFSTGSVQLHDYFKPIETWGK